MKKFWMFFVTMSLFTASLAQAALFYAPLYQQEESALNEVQAHCKYEVCEAPYQATPINLSKIDTQLRNTLQAIAEDQAQVWGDTILEGDYYSDGPVKMERALAIYKNQEFIAYWVEYSQKAWMTAECEFNYDDPATLEKCSAGRIKEAVYVAPNFKFYNTDENHFAEFGN